MDNKEKEDRMFKYMIFVIMIGVISIELLRGVNMLSFREILIRIMEDILVFTIIGVIFSNSFDKN